MNSLFKDQLIERVANVNRKRSRVESSTAVLNMAVFMIAFISLAVGYAISSVRPEVAIDLVRKALMQ
jgi:hypothetical protein